MARLDPHSWADSDQPQADHLTWRAQVDFTRRVLQCEARLLLRQRYHPIAREVVQHVLALTDA